MEVKFTRNLYLIYFWNFFLE